MTRKDKNVAQRKSELRSFHLFAGAGGGILADLLLGHQVIGACEIEEYPREVLLQRQRDGILPRFPIWDDVCTFDGRPWRGTIDVICGGFPCQDISSAGKGAGITGARSGLWKEYARIIDEVRPKYVFAENSPLLRTRGLGVVLEDLAEMGYHARWGVLGAWHVGAPHKRNRMWVHASNTCLQPVEKKTNKREESFSKGSEIRHINVSDMRWKPRPAIRRMDDGLAFGLDRLKAIGNGQVPAVAALAFTILKQRLTNDTKGNQ